MSKQTKATVKKSSTTKQVKAETEKTTERYNPTVIDKFQFGFEQVRDGKKSAIDFEHEGIVVHIATKEAAKDIRVPTLSRFQPQAEPVRRLTIAECCALQQRLS